MGLLEEAKGKVKEAAGDLTDNKALKVEGEAQATRAPRSARRPRPAPRRKLHEKKADMHEAEQKAAEA